MSVGDPDPVCTGGGIRTPYADAARELYGRGLFPIPCGGDDGKSATGIARWQRMKRPPLHVIERLVLKHGGANVGVVMGASSRCTVVDVDAPELVDPMLAKCGDTPLITRTPSGGVHLWYRHNGERCADLRLSVGLDVDVKGRGGLIVVPPSFNRITGKPYQFERGEWADLAQLPTIRAGALDLRTGTDAPNVLRVATVAEGRRNDWLHKRLLREAKKVATFDELLERAYQLNLTCDPPLPQEEVGRITVSVWNRTLRGQNWAGEEQRVILKKSEWEILVSQPHGPDGLAMLMKLRLSHEAEPGKRFAVSPKAMVRDDTLPGWTVERIRKAKGVLEGAGFLRVVKTGGRGAHDPHQYQLAFPTLNAEGLRNPTQYNVTPLPPPPPPSLRVVGDDLTTISAEAANANFGAKVRAERERRRWRQQDLAAKAGLSRPALANIERGRFGASSQARERILAALGVAA